MTNSRIKELEAELKAARLAEHVAFMELKKSVKKLWKFTLTPHTEAFRPLLDPSCVYYILQGTIVNADALKVVGYDDEDLMAGSMAYLYNKLSKRFVMSEGGGNLYIKAERSETWALLEAFIEKHPEGGDVTEIIVGQNNFGWGT